MEKNDKLYKAVLYTHSDYHTYTTVNALNQATNILGDHLSTADVVVVNVKHDFPLQMFLIDEAKGKRGYPQIYIGDVRIGFIDELLQAQESGMLKQLCVQNLTSSIKLNPPAESKHLDEQSTNTKSGSDDIQSFSWLEAGQWLMIGMVKGAWSAMAYLTSTDPGSSAVESKQTESELQAGKLEKGKEQIGEDSEEEKSDDDDDDEEAEKEGEENSESDSDTTDDTESDSDDDDDEEEDEEEEDEEEDEEKEKDKIENKEECKVSEDANTPAETEQPPKLEEFDIEFVRTNWLWRHQTRVFRFKETTFERIDPSSNSVRAVLDYNNVSELQQVDEKNIIIKFKDRVAEDQYLYSDATENIKKVIATIGARLSNGTQITIKIPSKIANECGAPQ